MKTFTMMSLVIILLTVAGPSHSEDNQPLLDDKTIDKISLSLKGLVNAPSVSCRNDDLIVSWHTRKFTVHRLTRMGRWTDDVDVITGPDRDGYLIDMQFARGSYSGALVRGSAPVLTKDACREPYFYTSSSLINYGSAHAVVNISFGDMADVKVIDGIYESIKSSISFADK